MSQRCGIATIARSLDKARLTDFGRSLEEAKEIQRRLQRELTQFLTLIYVAIYRFAVKQNNRQLAQRIFKTYLINEFSVTTNNGRRLIASTANFKRNPKQF